MTYKSFLVAMLKLAIFAFILFLGFELVAVRWMMNYAFGQPWWYITYIPLISKVEPIYNTSSHLFESIDFYHLAVKLFSDWYATPLAKQTLIGGVGFTMLFSLIGVLTAQTLAQLVFRKFFPPEKLDKDGFASYTSIKKAGLLIKNGNGAVIAFTRSFFGFVKIIYDESVEHILLFAKSGYGKSNAAVIPTLLTYKGSVFANDVKGELFKKTSGPRRKHLNNNIFKVNLSDPNDDVAAFFNPLAEVRIATEYEMDNIELIADSLATIGAGQKGAAYFYESAAMIFACACLHSLYKTTEATFTDVINLLQKEGAAKAVALMLSTNHKELIKNQTLDNKISKLEYLDSIWIEGIKCHPKIHGKLIEIKGKADGAAEEWSAITGCLTLMIDIFMRDAIKKTFSKSSFKLKNILREKKASTVYFVIHPSDKKRLAPLVRLMFDMLAAYAMLDNGEYNKQKLMLLIDEFPQLGKVDQIQTILEVGRSAGLKLFLICQDIGQLTDLYKNDLIYTMTGIHISYRPIGKRNIDYLINNMLGKRQDYDRSYTYSDGKSGSRDSENLRKQDKPLLTERELMNLPIPKGVPVKECFHCGHRHKKKVRTCTECGKDTQKIIKPGAVLLDIDYLTPTKQVYAWQPFYFLIPEFKKLLLPPVDKSDDVYANNKLPAVVTTKLPTEDVLYSFNKYMQPMLSKMKEQLSKPSSANTDQLFLAAPEHEELSMDEDAPLAPGKVNIAGNSFLTLNNHDVHKTLKDIATQTFPDRKIDYFQVRVNAKESKTKHGHWIFYRETKECQIHIFNLSRKTEHIICTTIHELAHHCQWSFSRISGHDLEFYQIYKQLLEKAHTLGYIDLDEIMDVVDARDIKMLIKKVGELNYEPSQKQDIWIIKVTSFELREVLKERGYKYSSTEKLWLAEVDSESKELELTWLSKLVDKSKVKVIHSSENTIDSIYYCFVGNPSNMDKELTAAGFRYDSERGWYKKIRASETEQMKIFCSGIGLNPHMRGYF
jgi:type IV secretory pathway TraG/TraD family ATPase VirD4